MENMVFLSTAKDINRVDYISRYLKGDARCADLVGEQQLVRELSQYLKSNDAAQLKKLGNAFPLLPGEQPLEASVQLLTTPWHSFNSGTLVYTRKTNMGSIAFGFPAAEQPAMSGAPAAKAAPKASAMPTVGSGETDTTVIDSALTLTQFAGFALGPEGLIVAGGAAILQTVFHSLLADQQQSIPEAEVLDNVLKTELTAEKLRDSLASFREAYAWFREYYENAWNDGLDDSQELKDFQANLNQVLGPNSNFLLYVNLLEDPAYEVPGFTAYLLGAGVHIVLLKIDLILKSSDRRIVDTPALGVLIDSLGQYLKNGTTANGKIVDEMTQRTAEVTKIKQDGNEYSFIDKGRGPNGTVYRYKTQEDAEVGRQAALELLQAQLNLQYYNGRPDKAQATLDAWESAKKQYEGYRKT